MSTLSIAQHVNKTLCGAMPVQGTPQAIQVTGRILLYLALYVIPTMHTNTMAESVMRAETSILSP